MADKLCSKLGTGVSAGVRTKWQNEFPKVLIRYRREYIPNGGARCSAQEAGDAERISNLSSTVSPGRFANSTADFLIGPR